MDGPVVQDVAFAGSRVFLEHFNGTRPGFRKWRMTTDIHDDSGLQHRCRLGSGAGHVCSARCTSALETHF